MECSLNHVRNKHLTICERTLIQVRLKDGRSIYAIAKELGCAYNTVKNELERGTKDIHRNHRQYYRAEFGQQKYEQNRTRCHRTGKFYSCGDFISQIEYNFSDTLRKWSIDASVGRMKSEKRFSESNSVCTTTVYNWLHKGLLEIKTIDLPEAVKRKKNRNREKNRTGKMNFGNSIDSRPAEVSERNTFGHWEIDTVIGKKKGKNAAVLTLVERLTDFYMARKIPAKMACAVNLEISRLRKEFGTKADDIFITLTSDRGSEFSALAKIEEETDGTKVYFAHPYSSYERGINERHNRILRRFIPKGTDINTVSEEELEQIQDLINGLPRKRLGYRTPAELFNEQLDIIFRR